jgi:hypothetical protein
MLTASRAEETDGDDAVAPGDEDEYGTTLLQLTPSATSHDDTYDQAPIATILRARSAAMPRSSASHQREHQVTT